jgi:(1->4)-alpha-D-glucan 1-alpha-D-glucosylmutase
MRLADVLARADEGLPKLWLVRQALAVRREEAVALAPGASYRPLWATGSRAAHAIAYMRGERVVALGTRLPMKLAGDWQGTSLELPEGRWEDVLGQRTHDGGPKALDALLVELPVALLVRRA